MSIEALRWALAIGEEQGLEPARRLVLIMLGNVADQGGGSLFPSYNYLQNVTGLGKSTIRAHMAALEKAGILVRTDRQRDDGGQSSNSYQLAMAQPGLPLPDDRTSRSAPPPPPKSGRGGPPKSGGAPARRLAGGRGPHTKVLKQELLAGVASPSPVAAAFKAYQEGIKRLYRAEYPPSAKANGQLANVVARVGGERVVDVVRHYLAHRDPFYGRTKHALGYLVRDCEKFSLELQAEGGAAAETAKAGIEWENGTRRELNEYPAGPAERIARTVLKEYRGMLAGSSARNIYVRQGARESIFNIAELAS